MLGPTKYRLRKNPHVADGYEFLDQETGRLVGVAGPDGAKGGQTGLWRTILDVLLSFRLSRYSVTAIGMVLSPFWLAGAILGIWPLRSRDSQPRLIVRRPGDGAVLFTLRVSSGLLYDSRRVYDPEGRLIAHFRSQSKSSVRGGFEIINLLGCEDDDRDISRRPRFGRVEPSGSGRRVHLLHLVDNPNAGRIIRESDHYDIDAAPELRHDPTSEILLLAAALTVAWSPGG